MTYERTDRDLETPSTDVANYYGRQNRNCDQYEVDVCFGYFDEEERKPAMILRCGIQDLRFNVKTAYLLRKMLKENPDLLDHFLDDWLLENAAPIEPSLGSSGSKKPKRRVAARPK
tara:strand:+ start:4425 stop:4772 length:348 start_codon:yes stop_codon:yes gene_type:complete